MEINESYFVVLHWQQWQPAALKITCKKVLMYQKYSDTSRVYYTLIETKIEN